MAELDECHTSSVTLASMLRRSRRCLPRLSRSRSLRCLGGGAVLGLLALSCCSLPSRRCSGQPVFIAADRPRLRGLRQPLADAAVAGIVPGALSLPAYAEEAAAGGGADVKDLGTKMYNMATTGADAVYDPSTEEGARALGLAFPVPTLDKLQQVPFEEFAPALGIFVVAISWGLLVVPNTMTRSDGTLTTYFENTSNDFAPTKNIFAPKEESKQLGAADAATPLIEVRRFGAVGKEGPVGGKPKSKAKRTKSKTGFTKR
eukprot:TRINITY_DN112368_c0_g1_i1.p2 TRINITY_DN112368_c0_g1~~TRINITY_DN112368_c0_g1_i1.p2  ORF type:complete len:260 (+),score=50.06 TRINITY_DN112368_c0_g1_i1:142-921(+)